MQSGRIDHLIPTPGPHTQLVVLRLLNNERTRQHHHITKEEMCVECMYNRRALYKREDDEIHTCVHVVLIISLSLLIGNHAATCQAMTSIKNEINGPSVFPNETEACTLSNDCLEITCREDGDVDFDLSFQMILLPCFSPPAVRIVFSGVIKFDYIFRKTESANVKGTTSHVYVQLDLLDDSSIGFQARFTSCI